MHDADFAQGNRAVPLAIWPRGSLRYLVGMSRRIWEAFDAPLTDLIVETLTENDEHELRQHGADKAGAKSAYASLCAGYHVDATSLPVVRAAARTWLEEKLLAVGVERATAAISKGDPDKARQLLEATALPPEDNGQAQRLNDLTPDFLQSVVLDKPGAIPTGLTELDKAWGGGYRPAELGMVVATTGVGKSMMLAFMSAAAMWAKKDVLYSTHELTPEQIKERVALALLGKGKRSINDTWDKEFAAAALRHGLLPTQVGDFEVRNDFASWGDLVAGLGRYKRDHGKYPDVLMLDSADDIAPPGTHEKEYQGLKAMFVALRLLAQRLNIAIWSTGQLSRDSLTANQKKGTGPTPTVSIVERALVSLKYIGDSFAKAQKSHYVVGLSQTEAEKNDMNGARANVYVLKDSLHGTTKAHLEVGVQYGNGDNGFAGFTVDKTHFP